MQSNRNATVDDDDSEEPAPPTTNAPQDPGPDTPPRPNAGHKKEPLSDENAVRFKDAVGRTFLFPYEEVRTWDGMETTIRRAFAHVDVIGAQVQMGHYDLIEDDNIILPQFWKYSVRPGSRFVMKMWPPMKPKTQVPPGFPGARPFHQPGRPGGLASGQFPAASTAQGVPPPQQDREYLFNMSKAEPPRRAQGSFVKWMTGKSSKKKQEHSPAASQLEVAAARASPPPGTLAAPKPRSHPRPTRLSFINRKKHKAIPVVSTLNGASSSESSSRSDDGSGSDVASSTASQMNDTNPVRRFVVDEQAVFSLKLSKGDIHEMESKVQRQPTFHGLGRTPEPFECLQFSSARIIGHDGSEPLELVRASCKPVTKNEGQKIASNGMNWIHVQRNHMDFGEFENIAHFELTRDVALRNAIGLLLRAVRDKKWDKDLHIKPGTVLRCDIHLEGKDEDLVDLSPIFASVPNLHVAKFNRKLPKDSSRAYCPPRRLHEAFGHLDRTAAHDKMQQFRQNEGAKTNEILWGGQTWILVTKAGLVTYGDASRAQLEGDSITVTDSSTSSDAASKIVQLIDSQNRLTFAPLDQCRSFFELQGVVLLHARGLMGDEVDTATVLRLETAQGEELTASRWSNLLRGNEIPMVRWHLEDPDSSDPESSSSSEEESSVGSGSRSQRGSSDRRRAKGHGKSQSASSIRRGRSRGRKTSQSTRPASSSQYQSRRHSRSTNSSLRSQSKSSQDSMASTPMALDHDDDDINFLPLNQAKAKKEEEDTLPVPEPDHRVPPFLSWMPSDTELSRSADALMQRLMMAEAGIIRIPKKTHRDALVEDAYQAFSQDDVFAAAKPQSFKDFEYRRKSFKAGGTRLRAFREGGRFPQSEGGKLTFLAENLLDMCVRVLEAFAPKDLPALSVTHCFGALSSVLQDPTAAAALKDSDAEISDPDLDDTPTSDKAERWVISLRAQSELAHPGQARCEDCSAGKVYKNTSKAITHLRRSHAVGLRADMHLKEYISTIQEASRERLKQDYREILLRCRKNMAGIAQKTARIQAGVIYQGGFKGPAAGLPPPLFKAFKLLVVFLCALPRLLDNVSWLYKVEVLRPRVRQLRSAKVDAQRQAVFKLGEAVEGQVHDAERVLASPELSSGSVEGLMKGRLMDVVGPSYVAMQVVHNILRLPVYGGKHVAELYDGYFKIQRSQLRRKPEKRLVLSIGALKDEMSLVTDFLSTQVKALDVVAAVLSPQSRAIPDASETATFEQLEMQVFNRANWHLTKQLEDLERIDKTLNDMDAEVRQRAEIMADQNSRAMMIFTVVTVFFLPPSFVAAYLSMGDGPDGLDFGGIQRRFWTIAGPLTAAVWAVCIFLAFEGTENSPLRRGRAALGKWRAEREERREAKGTVVDEDC